MMGMEMMFAKMIGKTPDDLKQTVLEFEGMVRGASQALISIAETQTLILARLTELENGTGK